jgi:hypothetical protein
MRFGKVRGCVVPLVGLKPPTGRKIEKSGRIGLKGRHPVRSAGTARKRSLHKCALRAFDPAKCFPASRPVDLPPKLHRADSTEIPFLPRGCVLVDPGSQTTPRPSEASPRPLKSKTGVVFQGQAPRPLGPSPARQSTPRAPEGRLIFAVFAGPSCGAVMSAGRASSPFTSLSMQGG